MPKQSTSLGAITALVPGLTVAFTGAGAPPGHALLFGCGLVVSGLAVVLLIHAVSPSILEMTPSRSRAAYALLAFTAVAGLVAYVALFLYCIVTHDTRGTVHFPLWDAGALDDLVRDAGGRKATIEDWGRRAVYDEVQRAGSLPMLASTLALLASAVTGYSSLLAVLGTAVVRRRRQPPLFKVFVSSTSKDLRDARDRVRDVIESLGAGAWRMETFGSTPRMPVAECYARVEQCDALVIVVANRYGWVPSEEDGGDGATSMTWLEVKRAHQSGIPVFPFIVGNEEGTSDLPIDEEGSGDSDQSEGLEKFKTYLRGRHVVSTFQTTEELGQLAATSLAKWLLDGRERA